MDFVRIQDDEFRQQVTDLMHSQQHAVAEMTHAIMLNDEIRGAYSETLLPCVLIWFNTNYRQPLVVYKTIEYIRMVLGPSKGYSTLIWPIDPAVTPYIYAERVDLTFGGTADFFISQV